MSWLKRYLPIKKQDDATVRTQIYDQLIATKKLEVLSLTNKVDAPNDQIDVEYKNIIDQYAGGDEGKFSEELKATYGLTPDQFKSDVIRLDVLQSNLALWHNQQESLNSDAYKTAKELQSKLQNGEKFETNPASPAKSFVASSCV